jgi:hypothetical protein
MSTTTTREPARSALMCEDFAGRLRDVIKSHAKCFSPKQVLNIDESGVTARVLKRKEAKSGVINESPNRTAFSGRQRCLQFLQIPPRKPTHPTDKITIGGQAAPHLTCMAQCQSCGCWVQCPETRRGRWESCGKHTRMPRNGSLKAMINE